MKHNYQLDTDAIISKLDGQRPRVLLQCCCGPCSSYVVEYLFKNFDVTVLFYNPNIQPVEEYHKRLYWLKEVLKRYDGNVELMECSYDGESFVEMAEGLEKEPEGGGRCTKCFRLRLEETAKRAKEGNFDYFCTTLTVSPHKDQERINTIGYELSEKYGVKWLPSDFKKREGYKRSIVLSREYGLYRQDYCGCLFSKEASERQKAAKEAAGKE